MSEEIKISPEDMQYMQENVAAVKKFLDSNGWHYGTKSFRPDLTIFELGINVSGVGLRARIHVEADPRVFRIDAILPTSCEETYQYPLCKLLCKENYSKRYGAYKYDERDGEISYEYSWMTDNGVDPDDLDTYFDAVVTSAASSFDQIRKYSCGKFKRKEVQEILDNLKALVDDINDDE